REVEMGPVITAESKQRVEALIGKGVSEGAKVLVDGRHAAISGYERGYFVRPTVLDKVNPRSALAGIELFGPVLSLMHAATIEEGFAWVNATFEGTLACSVDRRGVGGTR